MIFKTAGAFRRALEERLREQSLEGGQSLTRLRKMVAFDRFLARLAKKEPEACIVKGGFALQLRLGDRARTTKDIDLSATNRWNREETAAHLRAVASFAFGDWFEFEVAEPVDAATGAPGNGLRFPIRCLLDGRQFEYFHLDVGFGDPVLENPEVLTAPDVLAFADIEPAMVRCYPLTTQVAEKIHTYARTYASGKTSPTRSPPRLCRRIIAPTISPSGLQPILFSIPASRSSGQMGAKVATPSKMGPKSGQLSVGKAIVALVMELEPVTLREISTIQLMIWKLDSYLDSSYL